MNRILRIPVDFINNFYDKHLCGWFPEVALGYLPMVKEIKESGIKNPKILDVGSGPFGIAPYLGQKTIGLDMDFMGIDYPFLEKIKGRATKIPFKDSSFDFVVSSNLLEHLPRRDRPIAIKEMLRVGRQEVIIGMPCGGEAENLDKYFKARYQKIHGEKYEMMEQHFEHGLPQKEEVRRMIEKCLEKGKIKGEVRIQKNERLFLRKLCLFLWINRKVWVRYFYDRFFLLLIPILKYINFGKCYRQIFFIKIKK